MLACSGGAVGGGVVEGDLAAGTLHAGHRHGGTHVGSTDAMFLARDMVQVVGTDLVRGAPVPWSGGKGSVRVGGIRVPRRDAVVLADVVKGLAIVPIHVAHHVRVGEVFAIPGALAGAGLVPPVGLVVPLREDDGAGLEIPDIHAGGTDVAEVGALDRGDGHLEKLITLVEVVIRNHEADNLCGLTRLEGEARDHLPLAVGLNAHVRPDLGGLADKAKLDRRFAIHVAGAFQGQLDHAVGLIKVVLRRPKLHAAAKGVPVGVNDLDLADRFA